MAREEIPVTPSVITWARERAGFSLDEASEIFRKIAAWEAGDSFPTYSQLEQLADKFKLPIAVFFFPEPPTTPPIAESFRTLPEPQFSDIPRRVKFLLRKAKAFQLNLNELSRGANPANRLITRDIRPRQNESVDAMAARVRAYLGVSLQEQVAFGNVDEALEKWRQTLIGAGVFVFKDAFKVDDYSGFCLYDPVFPIIYVNNSSAKTRQIFTLFHELAHLLFHTSGVDTINDNYIPELPDEARRIEILCNRFAARFLVPTREFDQRLVERRPSEALAEELANHFKVSRELIFRIFLDRQLITEAVYARAAERWAQQRRTGTGGDYYNTQFAYLGPEYINLALKQFHQNHIDETQLADYLNIAPKNLSAFEERFIRRAS